MMEHSTSVNLYGIITSEPRYSHEYNGVLHYSFNFDCYRYREGNQLISSIRVYIPENLINSSEYTFEKGLSLVITGTLCSCRTKGVNDIAVVLSDYEYLYEITEDCCSYVKVLGEVTKIFTTSDNYKGFVNFVVVNKDPESGKKIFSTRVIIWNKLAEYILKTLNIGDTVYITGCINNVKSKSRPKDENESSEEVTVSEVLGLYYSRL